MEVKQTSSRAAELVEVEGVAHSLKSADDIDISTI
jgi:hypothetical protein